MGRPEFLRRTEARAAAGAAMVVFVVLFCVALVALFASMGVAA